VSTTPDSRSTALIKRVLAAGLVLLKNPHDLEKYRQFEQTVRRLVDAYTFTPDIHLDILYEKWVRAKAELDSDPTDVGKLGRCLDAADAFQKAFYDYIEYDYESDEMRAVRRWLVSVR